MIPYLLVALALAGFSLCAAFGKWPWQTRYASLTLLLVFVGLRYQLGYDWVGYERLFAFVPDDWDLSQYDLSRYVLATEPLYYLCNVVIKSLGGTFELLLFVLAAFNLFVIDRMAHRIAPGSEPFMWFIYFCVAMISIQFNIIRQAIASSFVIIALLYSCNRHNKRAIFWFVCGLGFHVSIIVFLPVFLLQRVQVRRVHIVFAILSMFMLFSIGQFLGIRALELAGGWLPEFIGSKTDNYIEGFQSGSALSSISPLAVLMICVYVYLIFVFLMAEKNIYVNTAIYLTILILFAHIALAEFPSFWNRVMCVSLPWQIATLWGIGYFRRMPSLSRLAMLCTTSAFSIGVMAYQLSRPESVPYVPYHSLAQVWLFQDEGDGRLRAEDTIRAANLQK